MNKPKWLEEGLSHDKSIEKEWKPLGAKGLPEAHLGSIKSQNVLPKCNEVKQSIHNTSYFDK